MNKLTTEERARVVEALVEGSSMRSVARMTGTARNTVMKLVVDLGRTCHEYQDKILRILPCKRLQIDEIRSFVYAKQKNIRNANASPMDVGDVWTFTAMDADTKLIPSWLIGSRDFTTAMDFMHDLADRLAGRVELTTDGMRAYLRAVGSAFQSDIDYAQLHKIYGVDTGGPSARGYHPPRDNGITINPIAGKPDPTNILTSYVERTNLTMRMNMRRFTQLTNTFSQKVEKHAAAIAIFVMNYNFARIHQTLQITPAMAAGVSDHVWEIEEIVALLDAPSAVAQAN